MKLKRIFKIIEVLAAAFVIFTAVVPLLMLLHWLNLDDSDFMER